MKKAKGVGQGGCCCGGCWSPPVDSRSSTTAGNIQLQQYCCKCIPKFLCATLTASSGYENSSTLLERYCGTQPSSGDAIQYAGDIFRDESLLSINAKLGVVASSCYLNWYVSNTSISGSKFIDHSIAYSGTGCSYGMSTSGCVEFGGTWTVDSGRVLSISVPQTLDIFNNINCGGCKCMCKCACISIYSRDSSTSSFTLVGSNDKTCATVVTGVTADCGVSGFMRNEPYALWQSNGWQFKLDGGIEALPYSGNILIGTGISYSPCSLGGALYAVDSYNHSITPNYAGSGQVIYYWDIDDRTPLSLKWMGLLKNENASLKFDAYNWSSGGWSHLGYETGIPSSRTVDSLFKATLGSGYVNSSGLVQVRLTANNSNSISTDYLKITTSRCCQIALTPPTGVTLSTTPTNLNLSTVGNCPSPFKYWALSETGTKEWYVTFECSWCGDNCGTDVSQECCPRPMPKVLFAEIELGCASCSSIIVVPLVENSPFIWDGTAVACGGSTFTVSFSCGTISVQGPGACSFFGSNPIKNCDPVQFQFSGNLDGGIGCCGPGSVETTTPITVTVIE